MTPTCEAVLTALCEWMPWGAAPFGFLSTPCASVKDLRKEVAAMKLPDEVGAMCLLAPGNNLTSSKTIVEAGEDFAKLLSVVCSRGHPVSQQ